MIDTNDGKIREKGRTKAPELKVVGIDYNVGSDAEDRLRRLFSILLRHAARQRQAATEKDDQAKSAPAKDHAGEGA